MGGGSGREAMAQEPVTGALPPVAGLDSSEGFRALVELSPDAVFVICDGYHVFTNARGLALFGASDLGELRTRPAVEFMDPSCRGDARARMSTMVDERTPLGYVEERILRLDGTPVDIEAAGTPIEVQGRPAALVVVRDITARRRADAALRAADLRFQAAFRHAPSAIALLAPDGRIVAANPTLGRLVGMEPEALVRTACWELADDADRARVRASFRLLVDGVGSFVRGDFRFTRPDGDVGWVHARANRLAGEPMLIVHLLDVTEAKVAEHELLERAAHDSLTGLDNRSRLIERLSQALRTRGAEVSILFCDLDGFKQINDRHGHAVGDDVLVAIASRMRSVVHQDDPMGRIGGDEFAVVLSGPRSGDLAPRVADRIRYVVSEPIVVGGQRLEVGISVGIASARAGTISAERLLAAADAAMYRDKSITRRKADGVVLSPRYGWNH